MSATIILITGANSGIGFACSKVLACASPSYHVIMTGRSIDKVNTALAEISSLPEIRGSLTALQLDVTDDQSINEAVEMVEKRFGCLDVLFNNAGIGGLDIPDIRTQYRLLMDTNVTGPAVVANAFRPLLLKSKNPYSVFVSSGARTLLRNAMQKTREHAGIGKGGAYQVTKAAINMIAVMEARDYGPEGLKVFAMSPGFVRSNLRGQSEEARSGWGMAGDPEESGKLLLSIVKGERDADVGCLVHKDGVFEW